MLSQVFEYARDVGLTEYNPCEGVERNTELPRDREALPWEVECLLATAPPLLALMIRFVRITGWRGHADPFARASAGGPDGNPTAAREGRPA